ncbi:MAG TPA: hypothetical protein VJI46_06350 [Candidatus Nanoarchaeia archaeon]|nr:hypothetical protein [Candidatus Nanoarchaeia archaeon]
MPEYVGEKIRSIPEFRVKYKDIYHMRNLYVMLHEYLLEEGFLDTKGDHEEIEKLYMEKMVQKGLHRGGKEMWIWWRLLKKPEGKYSGYFLNHLDIDFHMMYTQDTEIVHQGKKLKVQMGEIDMLFRPWIEADWQGKWKDHWLLKHFKHLYNERIMVAELDKREKELWRESYRVQGQVKKFLDMRQFMPVPEPFTPALYGHEG